MAEDMDRADPEGGIFIPECLANGLYRNEQCHKSTGYCWCVDQNSGKPIPGTSTQHVTPKCDERKQREFKGKARWVLGYSASSAFRTLVMIQYDYDTMWLPE